MRIEIHSDDDDFIALVIDVSLGRMTARIMYRAAEVYRFHFDSNARALFRQALDFCRTGIK